VLITYPGFSPYGMEASALVVLASGIFILPFFIVSPIAGQLADKYEQSQLIRYTKIFEVFELNNKIALKECLLRCDSSKKD